MRPTMPEPETTVAAGVCCAPLSSAPLTEAEAVRAAVLFKALADPARLRIVNLLATSPDPLCVCDVTPQTGLSQPTVSFHLKKLLKANIVEREQRGKWAHYSLRAGALDELAAVLDSKGQP